MKRRSWQIFLVVALLSGLALRLLWSTDMEYKEDEEYNFVQSQLVGRIHPWPALGMPSGVYIPNPGMSVWVFAWLARLARATDPVELVRALGVFAVLGIALVIPLALYFVNKKEREPWFWAAALAFVNPIGILYQRKLWPEPFMPFFAVLMLMGWFKRSGFFWALLWGLVGALLGQIHMAGFFVAAALFLWTLLFRGEKKTSWPGWLAGSVIGALPLVPWVFHVLTKPAGGAVSSGLGEALQLKYWVFWVSDPLGLHLGNALGLLRGNSHFAQLSDFIRYPILGGHATYLVGAAHLVMLAVGGRALVRMARTLRLRRPGSETSLLVSSAGIGCGLILTATTVAIRRYYMAATFPLEFVWLAGLLLSLGGKGRRWLFALWGAELLVSAAFVGYVHVNQGAVQGDYGKAYHVIMKERESMGPLPERPVLHE